MTYGGVMGGGGGREAQEGRDIRIYIANSFCCTAESNTILQSNYTQKQQQQQKKPCSLPFGNCVGKERQMHTSSKVLMKHP